MYIYIYACIYIYIYAHLYIYVCGTKYAYFNLTGSDLILGSTWSQLATNARLESCPHTQTNFNTPSHHYGKQGINVNTPSRPVLTGAQLIALGQATANQATAAATDQLKPTRHSQYQGAPIHHK